MATPPWSESTVVSLYRVHLGVMAIDQFVTETERKLDKNRPWYTRTIKNAWRTFVVAVKRHAHERGHARPATSILVAGRASA